MSAKRQVWTFGEWFRAQHGPRPGGEMTDEEMLEAVAKGEAGLGQPADIGALRLAGAELA
jgi:hypothetical protein